MTSALADGGGARRRPAPGRRRLPPPRRAAALAAAVLLLAGGCAGVRRKPPAAVEQRVTVVAERYQFIPATVDLSARHPVVLRLKSGDRAYGVELQPLGMKAFIPKGKDATLRFTPARAGDLTLRCTAPATQACLNMRATLRVR